MYRCRQCSNRANRSNVEDATGPLANHLFVNWFGHGKKTADVRIDDLIPGTIRRRRKIVAAIDGCVIDDNIEPILWSGVLSRNDR